MRPAARVLGVASLVGTIDRIEGDYAIVEWRNGRFSDVALDHLRPNLQEGDRVVRGLHTRPFQIFNPMLSNVRRRNES